MSKVAIKGNASGTGTFTLEAPNSNTDRTLVLPDEAGTVVTKDGSGTIESTNISDGTNSTSTTNVVKGSAKAWVIFNGENTPSIIDSYNVSSVDDFQVGGYDINLSITMSSSDYPVVAMGANATEDNPGNAYASARPNTTTQAQIEFTNNAGTNVDKSQCSVIIFGDEA